MKILLWPTFYFPNIGGLEKMVHVLACSLQKKGHSVIVFGNAKSMKDFVFEGVQVFTFPFYDALGQYDLSLLQAIFTRAFEKIEHFSPDVINIHGFQEILAFFQVRILAKTKIPACLTIHGLLEQASYVMQCCNQLWQTVKAVSTVSHALALPQPHPCSQTIYNGLSIPSAPLQPLPENHLLLIGRLTNEKCFSVAFRALRLLLPRWPSLQLTLIGDGPDYPMLAQLKDLLELPIYMPGFLPHDAIEGFIDRATLILVPSFYESFSLVALEAAMRGRPVVGSRVLGLKEVIEDQVTGVLVEPHDPHLLAQAIDHLLSDPSRMERMGRAGFERASRLFSIETTVDKYVKMYEKILSEHV